MANGELLKDLENDGLIRLAGVRARWVRPGEVRRQGHPGQQSNRMSRGSGPGRQYRGEGNTQGWERCRRDEATGFEARDWWWPERRGH